MSYSPKIFSWHFREIISEFLGILRSFEKISWHFKEFYIFSWHFREINSHFCL